MADLNFEDVVDEFRNAKKGAVKFETMKTRYVGWGAKEKEFSDRVHALADEVSALSDRVHSLADDILMLAKEIDPFSVVEEPKRRGKHTPRELVQEATSALYKLIQAGTVISMDSIEKAYPDWKYSTRKAILTKLQGSPNVTVTTGKHRKIFLSCKKEVL